MKQQIRKEILAFLKTTLDYDRTLHILAVSAKEIEGSRNEGHWKVRVALTYREGDLLNPYWDGTEIDLILKENKFQLLDEGVFTNEPPIIEGSPNSLALDWVTAIASPLWVSDEARAAASEGLKEQTSKEAERLNNPSFENPFT